MVKECRLVCISSRERGTSSLRLTWRWYFREKRTSTAKDRLSAPSGSTVVAWLLQQGEEEPCMKRTFGVVFALFLLPLALNAQVIAFDFSPLYQTASPAVVQITTDDGSASGFVV